MAISRTSCEDFLDIFFATYKYPAGKNSNRMSIMSIPDLDAAASLSALRSMREQSPWKDEDTPAAVAETASIVGGRLAYINRVSRVKDMVRYAKKMMHEEKAWLLSQIGLIKDCDDDVMDEQKSVLCFCVRRCC